MSFQTYFLLSAMMFLEFAIWGAWSPVLAAYLLGPLKMSGKQTGWIYSTVPLACIISPLVAGQIADRWVATEWILVFAHLIGGVLLLIAACKKSFASLFVLMGLYALFYASTLPLVNSLMFSQLGRAFQDKAVVSAESGKIFIWAPVAWVLAGWLLTVWRRWGGVKVHGSDALILAGFLSLIMGVFCLCLPHTPPPGSAGAVLPFVEAFSMLKTPSFLIFVVVSFVVGAQLQFYFLGTAQYLQDIGLQSKNIPAAMTIAQIAQAIATWFALSYLLDRVGFRGTLTVGVVSWLTMYLAYAAMRPRWFVVCSQALHGVAYVFFIIGGQIFVNSVAQETIASSAQALLFVVTMGFGLLLGARFTGIVMDRLRRDGRFQWRTIFLMPCVLTLACAVVLFAFFKG